MRVTNKLIIAVALFTALCVGLTFSVGAIRTEIINNTDYLIDVNLKLYDGDSLVYESDGVPGVNLYPASIVVNSTNNNFSINTYYSFKFPSDDGVDVEYNSGSVDIYKFWGNGSLSEPGDSSVDADTEVFLSKDILISKISCWMIFGFSDYPYSDDYDQPIDNDFFVDSPLYFGGSILDSSLYDQDIYLIGNYGNRQDLNSGASFAYRAFKVEYTFSTPISPSSTDPYDYACVGSIALDPMVGWNGLRYLVGCDQVDVEYYYREEYEAGILNSNKETVFDLSSRADDIISSLDVARPDQSVVDNLIDSDFINIVTDFQDNFGIFEKLPAGNFKNALTYGISISIGIAFIGYALHGKRG